jgi:hypothetical protein
MTDKDLTHLYFLLDRSGSMESIRQDIVGGFDAFIAEQRRQPGRCRVSLSQFDDEYTEVYADRPIADVPSLVLQPRGTTAMLDAIGRLIVTTGQRLAALPEPERPGTVLVGIMTDGLENASREYTRPQVRAMIQRQTREFDWTFLYMGANQDAVEVGTGLGIDAGLGVTYAPSRAADAMAATSNNLARMRGAVLAGAPVAAARRQAYFTAEQRATVMDGPGGDPDASNPGTPSPSDDSARRTVRRPIRPVRRRQ